MAPKLSAPPIDVEPQKLSDDEPALIDAKAAGKRLSVPATWMLSEARADRVPHVRLGRYVRFDPLALDAWWRARARGPQQRRTGADPVAQGRFAA
jgi:hypothetical protein